MLRVAGVVILYYPDNQVLTRVTSYLDNLDHLFIMDNSETRTDLLQSLANLAKVTYIHDGENKGISIRLNQAADLAIQEKYDWLLTMDQDSYFTDKTIVSSYFTCIEQYDSKQQTAMFGVQFLKESLITNTCSPTEVPHLITSGSVVNLNLYKKLGKFDEALFIDKVDHEYCLRAILHHYKIVEFNNIFLHHNLGNVTYGRSLKNFRVTERVVHSPVRMYYITRNYLYLKSKYPNRFPDSFSEMKKELWNRIKNNFLYGKNKLLLLKLIWKGYRDYKAGRMGKLSF